MQMKCCLEIMISLKKYGTPGGCLKTKHGSIIIEKREMIERWREYNSDLFHDGREYMPNKGTT